MDLEEILSKCDHTLLKQTATVKDIIALCQDAINFNTASVCIPACYVKDAYLYAKENPKPNGDILPICTVIGFPNGQNTKATKLFETQEALDNGATEIDMVINIGQLKAKNYDYVFDEISSIKNICENKILKVIIETCLLTDEEKVKMCEIVNKSGAVFIKTSTGFSTGGATFKDVELFARNIKPHVKIKAAGGISSLEDAYKFIKLGASRLGTSRIVKIAKSLKSN